MHENKWLTEEKFEEFLANDFAHVQNSLSKVERSVANVKGQLYVVIPLLIAILGTIIAWSFTR
jgi:hypothetical protein